MLHFLPLGDQGIQLTFGEQVDEATSYRIRGFMNMLERQRHLPIIECVPAYTTLSIYYDALKIDYHEFVQELHILASEQHDGTQIDCYVVEIPTCYGGTFGPDLDLVASHNNVSKEKVISLHASEPYLIYMLGFSPGFPYLGGMSDQIATPRRSSPRAAVAGGSVGIACKQTGIYPVDSPGGWNIIGRTPLRLYNPDAEQPILLQAGDYIRFVPIDENTFEELNERISTNQHVNIRRYLYNNSHINDNKLSKLSRSHDVDTSIIGEGEKE
jgi:inhibitor of KinA